MIKFNLQSVFLLIIIVIEVFWSLELDNFDISLKKSKKITLFDNHTINILPVQSSLPKEE